MLDSLELMLLESIIPGLMDPIPPMASTRGVLFLARYIVSLRFDIDVMGCLLLSKSLGGR